MIIKTTTLLQSGGRYIYLARKLSMRYFPNASTASKAELYSTT